MIISKYILEHQAVHLKYIQFWSVVPQAMKGKNVMLCFKKKMHILLWLNILFYKWQLDVVCCWLVVVFACRFSERRVLKSQTIIVDLSIFPSSSVNFCFMYLDTLTKLGEFMLNIVISSYGVDFYTK